MFLISINQVVNECYNYATGHVKRLLIQSERNFYRRKKSNWKNQWMPPIPYSYTSVPVTKIVFQYNSK